MAAGDLQSSHDHVYFKNVDHKIHHDPQYDDLFGSVNDYIHLNAISRGAYGVVHRVQHKKTGEILAMKEEFHGVSDSTIREVYILKSLPRHPSIVEFKEVVWDDSGSHIFVVMEHVETDLARYMEIRREPFRLCEVKMVMKQLLEGVCFLHENGVMHRDLKPSNILLDKTTGRLKICDFGLSRQFDQQCGSGCYTPGMVTLWYRAPELLLGVKGYSSAIDMWSVGCIMAELILKEVLFKGRSELDQIATIHSILGAQDYYRLSLKIGTASVFSGAPQLTKLGFDLLRRLLAYDPSQRITAKAALDHPWFREYYDLSC